MSELRGQRGTHTHTWMLITFRKLEMTCVVVGMTRRSVLRSTKRAFLCSRPAVRPALLVTEFVRASVTSLSATLNFDLSSASSGTGSAGVMAADTHM